MKSEKWQAARIGKRYKFSSAHYLTGVPDTHPCANMHGHNYVVEVEVRGEITPRTGFVVDFHELDKYMKPLVEQLDHTTLNDTIDNPTAENIALWFMDQVPVKYLFSVTVWETDNCYATIVNGDGFYLNEDLTE